MAKGLDGKFLHYGIRREDLELIIRDNTLSELGLGGKKYKRIKVTRLI